MLTFSERRRLVLAIGLTIVALLVPVLSGGNDSGSAEAAESSTGPVTASVPDDTSPADPAFLPSVESTVANDVITINVPARPEGTILTGEASFIRWPQTMGLKPCATPHALIGTIVTVTNLNNGRSIKCNNVSIEALRDGSVIILHTDVFLEIADLIDAPIPVEINF